MKKQSFVISAIILTLGGFFAKAIGAIYKIPLTNILGSSGMGLYYLVFPIYSLAITICGSGISVALTMEVAKCRKIRHRYNEQKLLRVALVFSFILSLILTIVVIIVAKPLSIAQGNINAWVGYMVIAPAIIISTLISTLRGYFQGIENMIPTTISLIIEQVVKLSLGLVLAHKLCVYGINYAVLGAILGVTLSEVVALIIICINFLIYKGQKHYNYKNLNYRPRRKNIDISKISKNSQIVKINKESKGFYKCNSCRRRLINKEAFLKIIKIAIPTTLSSLILPISTMLDSFMIINILVSTGYSSHISTIMYGLNGGVVQSLISVPIIIISAISTSLVPSLTGIVVTNDNNEISKRTTFFIKITWLLAIIIFVLIYVFAEDILVFLYGDGLVNTIIDELYFATKMLKFSSLTIVYYAFLQTFISILQSIEKATLPFVVMMIALIVRTFLVYYLTSIISVNIFGSIIANIIFLAIVNIVLCYIVKKHIDISYNFYWHLIKPLIIGVILMAVSSFLRWCLIDLIGYIWTMILLSSLVVGVYVFAIYYGKILTNKEKKYFKIKNTKFKRKV